MFKKFDKRVSGFSCCDIGWVKLSSAAFVLAVVKGIDILWDWNLLEKLSIWWFVGIFVVAAIKPMTKFCGKCDDKVKIKKDEGLEAMNPEV